MLSRVAGGDILTVVAEVIERMTCPAGNRFPSGTMAALAGLAVALGVGAPPALANLRAPVVIPVSPSAALAAPSVPLTVESEALTFICGSGACQVSARYEVTAAGPAVVRLEFILPTEVSVTATTNADRETVQVVPATPLRPEELRSLEPAERGAPGLFRADFPSALRAGRNTVTVSYSQPLGAEEVGYGYAKKGRMVQRFRYELWPLREWTRSPGFRVKLAVSIERPAPGWWERTLGNPRSVTCLTSDTTAPVPAGRLEQRGGQLWYEAELGPSIPDRITCFIGDESLMPRN
jgi:hypothetical protein